MENTQNIRQRLVEVPSEELALATVETTEKGKELTPLFRRSLGPEAYHATVLCFDSAEFRAIAEGLTTFIHEVGGHYLLGAHALYSYPAEQGPSWQVDLLSNLQEVGQSASWEEAWAYLLQIDADYGDDGAAGFVDDAFEFAQPRLLTQYLSEEALDAWGSITGPLVENIGYSVAVVQGARIAQRHPVLGTAVIAATLSTHAASLPYSWSAVGISIARLNSMADDGHDFANFALCMGDVTGIHPSDIALSTALVTSVAIPLIAFGAYRYYSARAYRSIADDRAVEYLIAKMDVEQGREELEVDFLRYFESKFSPGAFVSHEEYAACRKEWLLSLTSRWNAEEITGAKKSLDLIEHPSDPVTNTRLALAASSTVVRAGLDIADMVIPEDSVLENLFPVLNYSQTAMSVANFGLAAYQTWQDFAGSVSSTVRAVSAAHLVSTALYTVVPVAVEILALDPWVSTVAIPLGVLGSFACSVGRRWLTK